VVHPGKLPAPEDRTLGSVSLIEEAEFYCPHGCPHAVTDSQLGADVPYVPLGGAHTNEEVLGDLVVGLSLHY
jgi:hypothetical protein